MANWDQLVSKPGTFDRNVAANAVLKKAEIRSKFMKVHHGQINNDSELCNNGKRSHLAHKSDSVNDQGEICQLSRL